MFSHMMVGSNDIARSKRFYDALAPAWGGGGGRGARRGRLMYLHDGGVFMVSAPINGEPATHGNGSTVGFTMTPEQADAWQRAGVENGGTAIEDAPGVREMGPMKLYLAYLRDPDGNKLCAFHRLPAEAA